MADDKGGKPPQTLMGATAIRPPERKGAEKYTYILYDPKNGTILTRTPKSWALIIIFYCIYYSCLAGFWTACMTLFLKIQINEHEPKWMMGDSIIGKNPGIGVRPAQITEKVDTGIFALDSGFEWADPNKDVSKHIKEVVEKKLKRPATDDEITEEIGKIEGSQGYAFRMYEFFKAYGHNEEGDMIEPDCQASDLEGGYRKENKKFCAFDRTTLKTCEKFPYGYASGANFAPCVFLKLNRIMGLKPTPIDGTNFNQQDASLEDDDSTDTFLKQLKAQNYAPKNEKSIYIKCEGEYPADKEVLEGKMKMYPEAEGVENTAIIPLKYFPYDKKRQFNENPLVAIQFPNLFDIVPGQKATTHGRLVHIICKAYYDKVVHSKKDKAGLVKFELYLDDNKTQN